MTNPAPKPEKVRVPLVLTPEEAQELDDWQFAHRHRTRTAALKAMMRLAMETAPAPAPAAVRPAKKRGEPARMSGPLRRQGPVADPLPAPRTRGVVVPRRQAPDPEPIPPPTPLRVPPRRRPGPHALLTGDYKSAGGRKP